MRALVLAALVLAACDYPRPPPVGDTDGATIDSSADDGGIDSGAVDAPGSDGGIDGALIDARLIDAPIDAVPIDAPGTVTPALAPPTISTTLGTTNHYTLTITPSGGFTGSVALALSGLNTGWTHNLPTSTNVSGTTTVGFDVLVASDGAAAAGAGATLTVTATPMGQGPRTATATLTVANEYVFHIANGAGSGAHWGALTGTTLQLRNGSQFTIVNDDVVTHQIHTGGGVAGLAHQASAMAQGASYSVTLGSVGTDTLYCHVHSPSTGMFNVNVH